jgi:transcriptional regulator with XRE-family HTH domain
MSQVASEAGLSQQMVSYVERGMRNPTLDTLLRIAGVLKVGPVEDSEIRLKQGLKSPRDY